MKYSNVFDYFNTRSLHCALKFPSNFSPHHCNNFIISTKPQFRSLLGGRGGGAAHPTAAQGVSASARGVALSGAMGSSRHRAFARSSMSTGMHSKGASHHGSNKLLNGVTHLTATEQSSLQWATLIRCTFRGILFGQKAIDTFKPLYTEASPNAD